MDGYVTIGTNLDTKEFDAQIEYVEKQLEEIEHKLKQADMGFDVGDTQKLEAQYEKLINQLKKMKKEQMDFNKVDLKQIESSINKVGDSTSTVIKKVGKWALAIFGIRSAYNFVRKSVSTLSQYNEQLATDIEYINFALASTLQPVIERLVSLVFKLLNYINYISQAFFGINLFANATQESFNKTNKEAGKLKKTLTGFDEMNVVGDSSSGSGGSGLSPSSMLDLGNEEEVEKIKSFWDGIRQFWEQDFMKIVESVTGIWSTFIQGLGLVAQGIYFTLKGVFEVILGLFQVIVGLILGDTELIEKGWKKMCEGIKNLVVGLLEIIGGLLLTAVGFVVGILGEFFGAIYNILIKPVVDLFSWFFGIITDGFEFIGEKSKSIFSSIVNFFKNIIPSIINLFKNLGTKVGEVIGGAFKTVINGVLKAIETILNSPIKAINKLLDTINKVPGINLSKLGTFNLPRLAVGGVVNMPGKGVMVGNAMAGERGAEGVIPLTNSQMMEKLGETIGKYITINANITNTMNGRIISRELQKVNNNSDFAFNK